MTKLFLIVLFLVVIHPLKVKSQNDGPQMTVKSRQLRGKVKSITETIYSQGISFDKKLIETELYAYKTVFFESGFVDSSFSKHRDTFKLDYHYYWKFDTLISSLHPKVNSWGKTIFNKENLPTYSFFEMKKEYVNERWLKYDNTGKLIELKSKHNKNISTTNTVYIKNNDTTFTVKPNLHSKGEKLIINKLLQKVYELKVLSDTMRWEKFFKYNMFDDIVTERVQWFVLRNKIWAKLDKQPQVTNYEYNYDTQNNWTQRRILINNDYYQIEKREMVYW